MKRGWGWGERRGVVAISPRRTGHGRCSHAPLCRVRAFQVTKSMTLRYEALEPQREMPPAPS